MNDLWLKSFTIMVNNVTNVRFFIILTYKSPKPSPFITFIQRQFSNLSKVKCLQKFKDYMFHRFLFCVFVCLFVVWFFD